MQIVWSVPASLDRDRIFSFIEEDSSIAAVLVDERIRDQIRMLLTFPQMGREGRVEETRELVIQNTPYVVVYRVTGEQILILRVLHGRQQWPEELP